MPQTLSVYQKQKTAAAYEPALPSERPVSYLEAFACSLLRYAQADDGFGRRLRPFLEQQLLVHGAVALPVPFAYPEITVLVPRDSTRAWRRAQWLAIQLKANNLPGAAQATAILATWSRQGTALDPKPVVVGAFALAIPGITLGRFTRHETMVCIVQRAFAAQSKFEVAKKISQAGFAMIERALDAAGGNVRRLEPDIADWLYGERRMQLYTCDGKKMAAIERELQHLDIAYAVANDHGVTAVLAVSPAANSSFQQIRWELEAWEQ